MKKYILFFFFIVQLGFGQENTIPKDQMSSIKYEYNWKNEDFLIVNYRFPKETCSYDNYGELDINFKWLKEEVFAKLETKNINTIYVYADKLDAKSILDNKTHYDDIGQYFLKNIFSKKGNCYGVLIINKKGKYKYILGEYSHVDIQNLLNSLN